MPGCPAEATNPLVTIEVASGTYPGPVTVRIPARATPAAGTHARTLVVISPDGTRAIGVLGIHLAACTAGVYVPVDLNSSGVGVGWVRATGVSRLGGLIRRGEMTKIPHVLAMGMPYAILGSGHVWPATFDHDGGAPGSVPEGCSGDPFRDDAARKPQPARPCHLRRALALRGHVVDQTGGGAATLYPSRRRMRAASPRRWPTRAWSCRCSNGVTNNTPTAVRGPGARQPPPGSVS